MVGFNMDVNFANSVMRDVSHSLRRKLSQLKGRGRLILEAFGAVQFHFLQG